jgi:transcriptional regulator with XRE-family HTH domain
MFFRESEYYMQKSKLPPELIEKRRIFSERIFIAFRDSGMKKSELSKKLFVDPKTLDNWSSGITLPDVYDLENISNATGKTVAYFFGDENCSSQVEKKPELNEKRIEELEQEIQWLKKMMEMQAQALANQPKPVYLYKDNDNSDSRNKDTRRDTQGNAGRFKPKSHSLHER